jgi:hypothetical protein
MKDKDAVLLEEAYAEINPYGHREQPGNLIYDKERMQKELHTTLLELATRLERNTEYNDVDERFSILFDMVKDGDIGRSEFIPLAKFIPELDYKYINIEENK